MNVKWAKTSIMVPTGGTLNHCICPVGVYWRYVDSRAIAVVVANQRSTMFVGRVALSLFCAAARNLYAVVSLKWLPVYAHHCH